MVDNHWEQLVLGLVYQFGHFSPQKGQKTEFLDPKIVAADKNALKVEMG